MASVAPPPSSSGRAAKGASPRKPAMQTSSSVSCSPRSRRKPSSAPSGWPWRTPSSSRCAARTRRDDRSMANGLSDVGVPLGPRCALRRSAAAPAWVMDGAWMKPGSLLRVTSGVALAGRRRGHGGDGRGRRGLELLDPSIGSHKGALRAAGRHRGESFGGERRDPGIEPVRREIERALHEILQGLAVAVLEPGEAAAEIAERGRGRRVERVQALRGIAAWSDCRRCRAPADRDAASTAAAVPATVDR